MRGGREGGQPDCLSFLYFDRTKFFWREGGVALEVKSVSLFSHFPSICLPFSLLFSSFPSFFLPFASCLPPFPLPLSLTFLQIFFEGVKIVVKVTAGQFSKFFLHFGEKFFALIAFFHFRRKSSIFFIFASIFLQFIQLSTFSLNHISIQVHLR